VDSEHIIQDSCSEDETRNWLPHDPRVHAFIEKDAGMYDAINRGLRRASGNILAQLNCDEQYLPGALEAVHDFFSTHRGVKVLFAHTVAVDSDGEYLFHRKALVPGLLHTSVCPLSTLTCATFFRREILDAGNHFFDPRWKIIGDSAWMLALLRSKIPMAVMPMFTSAFTVTGKNLSLDAKAGAEVDALRRQSPAWVRLARPLLLLHHRLRRWAGGVYSQKPFSYSIYTASNPSARTVFHVASPTFRWRWPH
jgi:glycosyltransferase involved in cell wall biosynthesis